MIEIPSFAPMMASMVGLGVGIDYALFVVTRHREHLALGMPTDEAAAGAVATAGQAVVFAGGTVVVSILGLAVAGIPFLTAAGIAISLVVLIMVAGSITLVPALLALAGGWINRLGLPTLRRRGERRTGDGAAGGRGGARTCRSTRWRTRSAPRSSSWRLAAPVLSLRLGVPDDGTLPESRTERRAYDLVADGFGPGTNGPLVIAVDISRDAVRARAARGGDRRRPRHRVGGAAGRRPRGGRGRDRGDPHHRSPGRCHPRHRRAPARRGLPAGARADTTPSPTSAATRRTSPTSPTACRTGCCCSSQP